MVDSDLAGNGAFVTGATGAVGLALVRRLLDTGWRVFAMHRPTSDIAALRSTGATLIEGDIVSPDTIISRVPSGVDAFFHVAADLSTWSRNNAAQMRCNVDGTKHAVEAALQADVGRFIHTSTVSAYGRHPGPIVESTPSVAENSFICYERSKWLAELEVRKGIERGLDAVIISPCAIMGPGFTAGWAVLLYQLRDGLMKALPPGKIVVNHIDEVVDAHIAAFAKGKTGENYILTGDSTPIATLIREAGNMMGLEVKAGVLNARLLGVVARLGALASRFSGKEPDLSPEMAAMMSQQLVCATDKACRELGYKEVPWEICLEEMYQWLHARGGI